MPTFELVSTLPREEQERALNPSTTSDAYNHMAPRWHIVDALLGGTETMREAGETYLPKHEAETEDSYVERLERATLLNMTEITIERWVGLPFSKAVAPTEEVPEDIKQYFEDIDLQGTDLAAFLQNWFTCGIAHGVSHVMIDFPRIAPAIDEITGEPLPRTLADDFRDGVRPYWVHVDPRSVIFAHSETVNGVEVLVHLRIMTKREAMVGFIKTEQREIKVYEPGTVETFVEVTEGGKVKWISEGVVLTGLPFIPLVTYYAGRREDLHQAKSPILDLAYKNVEHWQSSSDQQNILTAARFPMLAATGIDDEDQMLELGPRVILKAGDPSAKFFYVEHTGKAIEAGRQDLIDLEQQMAAYGAEFVKRRPGTVTATARTLDSAEATSALQKAVRDFMEAVQLALKFTAAWLGHKLTEPVGKIEINTEFDLSMSDVADFTLLAALRKERDISRLAATTEAKRRGVLGPEYDPQADAEQLALEFDEMESRLGLDDDQPEDEPEE